MNSNLNSHSKQIYLTDSQQWKALAEHYAAVKDNHLRDYFKETPQRARDFTLVEGDICFDYSKNRITPHTLKLLLDLAEHCQLKEHIKAMFNGEKINRTEKRGVLHVALRNRSKNPVFYEGKNIMPDVKAVLRKMKRTAEAIRSGKWKGFTEQRIENIVNIGIGGSDLGPLMVTEALKFYSDRDLNFYFVSNVDGTDITETLRTLEPANTLFIVASKTFTTQETLTNALTARSE